MSNDMDNLWIKLADFGEYPHEEGIQVVNFVSGEEMVRKFHALRSRFVRKYEGVPIYIGHPDDPKFAKKMGHNDKDAYAWVEEIDSRNDGIWIRAKWTDIGKKVIKEAFFKYLSPRWKMKKIGNKRYQPVQLISIGLTNKPNIPNLPILQQYDLSKQADEVDAQNIDHESSEEMHLSSFQIRELQKKEQMLYEFIRLLDVDCLSLTEERQCILDKLEQIKLNSDKWQEEGIYLSQMHQDAQKEVERFYRLSCIQQEKIGELSKQVEQYRQQEIDQFLSDAVATGAIHATEREEWKVKYISNPESAKESIRKRQIVMNTSARTEHLSSVSKLNKDTLVLKVHERMQQTGESYTEAWNSIKLQMPLLF